MTIQLPLKISPFMKRVWTAYGPLDQGSQYRYKAPDGTLWNIDRVEYGMVHLWTISAWGNTHYKSVNVHQFKKEWRETI